MSAYICNPEHFGALGAFATLNGASLHRWTTRPAKGVSGPVARVKTAQRVATELAKENIRSVQHRYPDWATEGLPGPDLSPADIIEAAALYAAHFVKHPLALPPVQILTLCRGLDYQSCETDDWYTTLAFNQLRAIEGKALRLLPGYDHSDWSFDGKVPGIDALYRLA